VRAYDGPIDQNLGTIDTESLSLTVNMEDSAAVRPAGGSYPPGERVPVSVTAEPGFVFRQWEDAAGGWVPNSRSRDTWLMMDGPRSLNVIMRHSYSQPEHSYGEAPYDSTYTPHGVTSVNLTGLVNSYTPVHGSPQSYFPARVRITAQDFPMDDPMREVVLSGIDDVRDAGGMPIPFAWPAGTVLTIQAEPYAHPAGFDHILLAWNTSPGTTINQCPTPEQEHSFTVPSLNPGQSLQLSLVTGVVHKYVVVPFAIGEGTSDYSQTHGSHDYEVLPGVPTNHRYTVIGPRGASQQLSVEYLQFQDSKTGILGFGWGTMLPEFLNGELYFPPLFYETKDYPIIVHGDLGDTRLISSGVFVDGSVQVASSTTPQTPYAANPALEPGSGTIQGSDDTPIAYVRPALDAQGKLEKYNVYVMKPVKLETETEIIDINLEVFDAAIPGGIVNGNGKYRYDPGDPNDIYVMQPEGRLGEWISLEVKYASPVIPLGWAINGIKKLVSYGINEGESPGLIPSALTSIHLQARLTSVNNSQEIHQIKGTVTLDFDVECPDGIAIIPDPDNARESNMDVTPGKIFKLKIKQSNWNALMRFIKFSNPISWDVSGNYIVDDMEQSGNMYIETDATFPWGASNDFGEVVVGTDYLSFKKINVYRKVPQIFYINVTYNNNLHSSLGSLEQWFEEGSLSLRKHEDGNTVIEKYYSVGDKHASVHYIPQRYPRTDVPTDILEIKDPLNPLEIPDFQIFNNSTMLPEGNSAKINEFFTVELSLPNELDMLFVRDLYIFENNIYKKSMSGGITGEQKDKMILNLDFIVRYPSLNFSHLVFHEIGHAVGLPHMEMEINGVKHTDFPDNAMCGYNTPAFLEDGVTVNRLRNMWIRNYKPIDTTPQIFSQPTRFEAGYQEWKDPNRLAP